jgi:hypothetical protein
VEGDGRFHRPYLRWMFYARLSHDSPRRSPASPPRPHPRSICRHLCRPPLAPPQPPRRGPRRWLYELGPGLRGKGARCGLPGVRPLSRGRTFSATTRRGRVGQNPQGEGGREPERARLVWGPGARGPQRPETKCRRMMREGFLWSARDDGSSMRAAADWSSRA